MKLKAHLIRYSRMLNMPAILMIASLIFTTPVISSEVNNLCISQSEMAQQIMTARQNGVPISKMLGTLDSIEDKTFRNIVRYIIEEAYDVPRFRTAQNQEHAKVEFGNKFYKLCSNALSTQ